MKKFLLIALAATLLLLSACACAEPINVYALKGPTGIGMSYLMDDTDSYAFTLAGAADEIVAAVASGSARAMSSICSRVYMPRLLWFLYQYTSSYSFAVERICKTCPHAGFPIDTRTGIEYNIN